MPGPLTGVRVLELARILAGPWAGQILADLGADVIKVERKGTGDDTRGWGPPFVEGADGKHLGAAYFHATNRGKRSIELDFETEDGQRIVRKLAARPALEWRTGANMTAYTAAKAALAAFTVALAEEVAKQDILVNAVAPSIMDTPANRAAMPKADHAAWPKVEEVARTILFLASPDNRVTRGAVVPVYGRS